MLNDREMRHPGYWPSPWPVECGGNRRQKASVGALNAEAGAAQVVHRRNDRWNVMVVGRAPGEWYLGGTMAAFTGPPPFGWVGRIDGETLQPLAGSAELPCGEHVWCGAILAHRNGDIYSVNGSYLHRLDAQDLSVKAERALPVSRSHNGLLVLADGSLITKDLRLENQGGTTITRLDPESLALIGAPLVLPEGSMGRIAADLGADDLPDAAKAMLEGVEATERDLQASLQRHKVMPINPMGEKFDPNQHEAMFEAPGTGQAAGTIIEVIEIGYVMAERLLRPAKVGIAKD